MGTQRRHLLCADFPASVLTTAAELQVDGGCGVKNIKEIAEAGADMFVAGSAIFNEPRTEENYKGTISKMREELAAAKLL